MTNIVLLDPIRHVRCQTDSFAQEYFLCEEDVFQANCSMRGIGCNVPCPNPWCEEYLSHRDLGVVIANAMHLGLSLEIN